MVMPNRERDYTAGVRLSPKERAELRLAAAIKGMSLTAYLRWAALERVEMENLMERMREQA